MSIPAAPDLWHHYGATTASRPPLTRLHWDWYQRLSPGEELFGDLANLTAAELGAGSAAQAAYVAQAMEPARVLALDSSAAQHARSVAMHGDIPRLQLVLADAATYLTEHPATLDIAYSLFGALDFSDPQTLLPAVAVALRPGGRLIFSTLGHYKNGAPPATECQPATVPTRMPDGAPGTIQRWVLAPAVWVRLLDQHGFDVTHAETLHDAGPDGAAPMDTTLVVAVRRHQ